MAPSDTRESRAFPASPNDRLVAPSTSRQRSTSSAPSCYSDITTVENVDSDSGLDKKALPRQQTFVVDTELSFFDLFKGMFWRTDLRRKIEASVKPVYSERPDEEMFDHGRSPFDLDVHVAPKVNSTEFQTIRCWFDTGCFQGNIVSKEFVSALGFDDSDFESLTTRESYGGQMMNGAIHPVEAAILLSWHHNTGPRYRDMRFLISAHLDSHTMIIGVRSIVKYNLLSPPVFPVKPNKVAYGEHAKQDAALERLQLELVEINSKVKNLDRALKQETSTSECRKIQEKRTAAGHAKDMQQLKIEIRETELSKAMSKIEKQNHIDKLKGDLAQGEKAETERTEKLSKAQRSPQASPTKSTQKAPPKPN